MDRIIWIDYGSIWLLRLLMGRFIISDRFMKDAGI